MSFMQAFTDALQPGLGDFQREWAAILQSARVLWAVMSDDDPALRFVAGAAVDVIDLTLWGLATVTVLFLAIRITMRTLIAARYLSAAKLGIALQRRLLPVWPSAWYQAIPVMLALGYVGRVAWRLL